MHRTTLFAFLSLFSLVFFVCTRGPALPEAAQCQNDSDCPTKGRCLAGLCTRWNLEVSHETTPDGSPGDKIGEAPTDPSPELHAEPPADALCQDKDQDGYCANDPDPQSKDCDDNDKKSFPGAPEICDGKDNNCNGQTDEIFPQQGDPCDTGQSGACARGGKACQGGKIVCELMNKGSKEICDGKDNNCNGQTDESFPQQGEACSTGKPGICADGTKHCANGQMVCQQTRKPAQEECNGKDDDCDGETDEPPCTCTNGATQSCYTGPQHTAGVGLCRQGKQTCQNNKWGPCVGENKPAQEICDGKDNDCDGQTDEEFPHKGDTCSTGQPGICDEGTVLCQQGKETCQQKNKPAGETCDGKDNDCDGKIDEDNVCGACTDGQTRPCYTGPSGTQGVGVCQKGTQSCKNKQWSNCAGEILPSSETCNGKDDDCDGILDESFAGIGDPCKTSQPGVCAQGLKGCQGGKILCEPLTLPSKEICDGKDNDCDGKTDEGGVCGVCNNGDLRRCYTGPASTRGVGECQDGSQTCQNGQWETSCIGEILPSKETCNNKDDDCDGNVDEGSLHTYYPDADGDSYGNYNKRQKACSAPQGYVSRAYDCYDKNSKANPSQKNYFEQHRGDGSFDYNCNNRIEHYYSKQGSCKYYQGRCYITYGYRGSQIPSCGTSFSYLYRCERRGTSCVMRLTTRRQHCR